MDLKTETSETVQFVNICRKSRKTTASTKSGEFILWLVMTPGSTLQKEILTVTKTRTIKVFEVKLTN